MKYILILLMLVSTACYGQQDSITRIKSLRCVDQECTIIIKQDIWFEFGKWHLLTTDGSLYDNIIHGDLQFIEAQKPIEINKALAKRKVIAIIIAKCKTN